MAGGGAEERCAREGAGRGGVGRGASGEERRGDWLARAGEENASAYLVRGLQKAFERIGLQVVCYAASQISEN
jgi:hypothetical protein